MRFHGSEIGWTDAAARQALARYASDVQRIARCLVPAARRGRAIDRDDLVAEGNVAVLEALSDYEGWGVSEATWVRTRVRVRMIDAIRRMDICARWRSGDTHVESRDAAGARPSIRVRSRPAAVRVVSLEADPPADAAFDMAEAHWLGDAMERKQILDLLPEALASLTPRERDVLTLRADGLSLKEVGKRLSITESRACRLAQSATGRLRKIVRPAVYGARRERAPCAYA